MVDTRYQTARNISSNMDGSDRYRDTESEGSVPAVLTRDQMREFDNGNLLLSRNEIERLTVNQRSSEMNKQITELTNLVLVLAEKISSSNREGNDLNTVSIGHETRSDKRILVSEILTRILETPPLYKTEKCECTKRKLISKPFEICDLSLLSI